jgi:hypothetical protein
MTAKPGFQASKNNESPVLCSLRLRPSSVHREAQATQSDWFLLCGPNLSGKSHDRLDARPTYPFRNHFSLEHRQGTGALKVKSQPKPTRPDGL